MNVEKTLMQHMRSGILVPGRRDTIFRSLNKNNIKKYFNLDVNFMSN
jgi:hypothetical protein